MGKRIFVIASLTLNIGLLALVAVILNSLSYQTGALNSVRSDINLLQNQRRAIESENKTILDQTAILEQQISSLTKELALARQTITELRDPKPATGPAVGPEPDKTPAKLSPDERRLKARRFGQMLAKIDLKQFQGNSPNPETLRQMSELLNTMADLGLPLMEHSMGASAFLADASSRQLLVQMLIGAFEELGNPLDGTQVAQYQQVLERMGEMAAKLSAEHSLARKMIVQLQNSQAIRLINEDMKKIFTEEQRGILESEVFETPFDLLPSISEYYVSSDKDDCREKSQASNRILKMWTGYLDLAEDQKNILKPLAEQYVNDYIVIRNIQEGIHGRAFMDIYTGRTTQPDSQTDQPEERERIRNSPEYLRAKDLMDMEFLQLIERYNQEISGRLGSAKAAPLAERHAETIHFPNIY